MRRRELLIGTAALATAAALPRALVAHVGVADEIHGLLRGVAYGTKLAVTENFRGGHDVCYYDLLVDGWTLEMYRSDWITSVIASVFMATDPRGRRFDHTAWCDAEGRDPLMLLTKSEHLAFDTRVASDMADGARWSRW